MRTKVLFALVILALAGLLVASSACAPKVVQATRFVEQQKEVAREAAPIPTAAVAQPPAAAQSQADKGAEQPAAGQAEGQQTSPISAPYVSGIQAERMIVKHGEMKLLVQDSDRAIDDVTRIAMTSGGYILGTEASLSEGYRYAKVTLGVPVEQFEAVQKQLRALAVQVLSETSHGTDVSDEYVDLQSRLTNLDATAARMRSFLDRATTITETLQVNEQLSVLEADIEKVKGRMNYLRDRSAYSTLEVYLEPQRPTATPTTTPTVTPTLTPTPTTTPVAWRPGRTVRAAGRTLGDILRVVGDLAIWVVVVLGPLALPFIALGYLVWRRNKNRPPKPPAQPKPPAPPAPPAA